MTVSFPLKNSSSLYQAEPVILIVDVFRLIFLAMELSSAKAIGVHQGRAC